MQIEGVAHFGMLKVLKGFHQPKENNAMLSFVQRHADSVMGVLNGFDRLLFRGTLRRIANAAGLGTFLSYMQVLLKDAGEWMELRSDQVEAASRAMAQEQGRPVEYQDKPSV